MLNGDDRRLDMDLRLLLGAMLLACASLSACTTVLPPGLKAPAPVPPGPDQPAALVPPPPPPATPPVELPESLLAEGSTLTLAAVVDVALKNNPLTRTSYLQALSALAELGAARAAYYPTVDLSGSVSRSQQSALGGQFSFRQTTYGPTVGLSYLVLDLGGRAADAEEMRLGLLAADWRHNATVQDVILGVQQTFFDYLAARSLREAAQVAVEEAETALAAARERHDAGVATIADVLQATTAVSQARLSAASLNGQVMALRGSLATAMGLPANTPYDVGRLPEQLPLELAAATVESLIAEARAARPDLVEARLRADKADLHVRGVRSEGLPSLSAFANASRSFYEPSTFADYGDSWSARLVLDVPLFTGFEQRHRVEQARQDAAVAHAQAATHEQQVVLEVWTSYYGLETASQLVRTSQDLVASAEQSERVAMGRYREGVGTIIEMLAAQAALASARAQEIEARATWLGALARLARDVGAASPILESSVSVIQENPAP